MQSEIKNYDDSFETCLFQHCKEGETGTVLIATNNNRSCQISIDKGEVVAVSMGKLKGYEVTTSLLKDGIKRASFTQNMNFPHSKEAFINSGETFLNRLNGVPSLTLV